MKVTNPWNFFASDEEIQEGVETVKKYKGIAKETGDGKINITHTERQKILRGVELMNSCTNDVGDIVYVPWRMCSNLWVNIPIISGMMLSPPTMGWTLFSQWINQNYNAGLNYGNKNGTCKFSN